MLLFWVSTVNKIALTIIIRSAMAIGAISLKRKLFTMEFCLLFLPAGESGVKKFSGVYAYLYCFRAKARQGAPTGLCTVHQCKKKEYIIDYAIMNDMKNEILLSKINLSV